MILQECIGQEETIGMILQECKVLGVHTAKILGVQGDLAMPQQECKVIGRVHTAKILGVQYGLAA